MNISNYGLEFTCKTCAEIVLEMQTYIYVSIWHTYAYMRWVHAIVNVILCNIKFVRARIPLMDWTRNWVDN